MSLARSLLILAMLPGVASGGTHAGVTMPDRVSLGGQELTLNGMGTREKYFLKIYVGGLYLPSVTRSAAQAMELDTPKRITMHFVYREVPAEKLVETFGGGFAQNPSSKDYQEEVQILLGWMEPVRAGDVVHLDYVPGVGVSMSLGGRVKGPIGDHGFMKVVFAIFIGEPAHAGLREGLLGG